MHDVVFGPAPGCLELSLAGRKLALALGLLRVFYLHQEGAAAVAHEQVEAVLELVAVQHLRADAAQRRHDGGLVGINTGGGAEHGR